MSGSSKATSFDLAFCDEFAYPPIVRRQLKTILSAIVDPGIKVLSVMVVGSTARGELSYVCEAGSVRLFSDYELSIVTTDNVDGRAKAALESELEALGRRLCPGNPLFHIDLGWSTVSQLPNLPHTVAVFEHRSTGKVVFGRDFRVLMPEISVQSLQKRIVNEILCKRLWALLLYLPKGFLGTEMMDEDARKISIYVLARNALDLATVLLPQEGVLLPTYTQRIDYLSENRARLAHVSFLGSGYPELMEKCLGIRRTLVWEGSPLDLYVQTIEGFERALEFLLGGAGSGLDLCQRLDVASPSIFQEVLPRRRVVRHMAQILVRRRSVWKAFRWPFLRHKGTMTCIFLNMHWALAAHLGGDVDRSNEHLMQAWRLLDRLSLRPVPRPHPDMSFDARWMGLRRVCSRFWCDFVRQGRPTCEQRHDRVLSR